MEPTKTNDTLTVSDKAYEGIIFPSLAERIKAVFFDVLVMLGVFASTSVFIDTISDISEFTKGFIFISMLYLYDPVLISMTGSTLGHKAMKLKVRRFKDPDRKISLWQAFVRFFIKGILGWLSFLTVTASKQRRAIHDFASGSIILRDK